MSVPAQKLLECQIKVDTLRAACEAVNRVAQRSLLDGYGCPFCKHAAGHYSDGEYWHGETCPLEQIERAVA